MRCCHCNKQIMHGEFIQGKAHELMGVVSHVACDNEQLDRQEKLIRHYKSHVFETSEF